MASNAVVTGPAAARVAANVERIRRARQLHQKDLSAKLREVGRPTLPTVISKIERGERRVDVDDLVALALALNVSPAALLLPPDWSDDPVALTTQVSLPSKVAWQWVEGRAPASNFGEEDVAVLEDEDEAEADYWRQRDEYEALTHPPARRRFARNRAARAAQTVSRAVEHFVSTASGDDPERARESLETALARIDQLKTELELAARRL